MAPICQNTHLISSFNSKFTLHQCAPLILKRIEIKIRLQHLLKYLAWRSVIKTNNNGGGGGDSDDGSSNNNNISLNSETFAIRRVPCYARLYVK
jgi:hypothetical protein